MQPMTIEQKLDGLIRRMQSKIKKEAEVITEIGVQIADTRELISAYGDDLPDPERYRIVQDLRSLKSMRKLYSTWQKDNKTVLKMLRDDLYMEQNFNIHLEEVNWNDVKELKHGPWDMPFDDLLCAPTPQDKFWGNIKKGEK